jgi:hypothetical protein
MVKSIVLADGHFRSALGSRHDLPNRPCPKSAEAKIDPTGKSLPICGNRVKPQNKKYFAFPEGRNKAYLSSSRPDKRGVS